MTPPSGPRSAYIHVPFCRHRCGYCDFAVIAGRDDLVPAYLSALGKELTGLQRPRSVDTLYFGGGTPSHLTPKELEKLVNTVRTWHPTTPPFEWTVEANPESLDDGRIETLAEAGVTRISLGVQSFNEVKLRGLDRQHDRAVAIDSVRRVQRAGLHVAIDLIFAVSGETLDSWRRDVADAVALAPDHVSTYGLTFESGTAFTVARNRGSLIEADEELQRAMYAAAMDDLTAAGFEHYEVSNFARPGRCSRHNEAYWAGDEYFAAGPGAARYVDGVRETNIRSTLGYLQRIERGESPVAEREELDAERRARERLVFGLRRLRGVEQRQFAATTGFEIEQLAGPAIARFIAAGLLEEAEGAIRLTREGLFVSDALWPDLL
jgi:oxygen-independent coproporphyrinogen III oxidase